MRGDIIYEVVAIGTDNKTGNPKGPSVFNTSRTREEAEEKQAALLGETDWAGTGKSYKAYWDDFVIQEKTVDTDFEIPSLPMPRNKYFYTTENVDNGKGVWNYLDVTVEREYDGGDNQPPVTTYRRNYGTMYRTFEPFRQEGHDYALISDSYVRTSVLDLETGTIIASEPEDSNGFCPVGFYVPDWWDIHDDSEIPGSKYWTAQDEQPSGQYGFVWGCVWGDDNGWKVQYLDLSDIKNGVITRDERFGYLELATTANGPASEFIRITDEGRVRFSAEVHYTMEGVKLGMMDREQFLSSVRKQFGYSDLTEIIPAAEWFYDNYRDGITYY